MLWGYGVQIERNRDRTAKCAKNIYIHYYPILNVYMNNSKGRGKFNNFKIFLDSGCIYKIITLNIASKMIQKKDVTTQWKK